MEEEEGEERALRRMNVHASVLDVLTPPPWQPGS